MKPLLLALLAAFALLMMPGTAQAQTCSATVSSIDFGSPSLLSGGSVDVTGTVTVTCTGIPLLSVVKICPGIGAGSGGTDGSARLMTGPAGSLRFQLYQDAARSIAWGSLDNPSLGSVPPIIISNLLNGAGSATRSIYARLFDGQATAVPGLSRQLHRECHFVQLWGRTARHQYQLHGVRGLRLDPPDLRGDGCPAKGCTVAATDLTFPPTGVLSRVVTAQSGISLTCTNQTPYALRLDAGRNADASGTRRMRGASGGFITYGLFRDAALSSSWDSGVQASGTGLVQALAVHGRVPAQATPAPGVYSDTVVVTVTY